MKNISGITDAYALEIDDYLIGIGSYRQDSNGTWQVILCFSFLFVPYSYVVVMIYIYIYIKRRASEDRKWILLAKKTDWW